MTSLTWLFIVVVVVPTTLWIALVIHYHLRRLWMRWCVSLIPLVSVGIALRTLPFSWALALWLGLFMAALAWRISLRPRSQRDWAVGMERLPFVELQGSTLYVRNFRNFDYTEMGAPIPHYEERNFDLAQLSSVDYYLSH